MVCLIMQQYSSGSHRHTQCNDARDNYNSCHFYKCHSFRSLKIVHYSISKTADLGLVRSLAVEWGPKNINVNALLPGIIKTNFARALWENPEILGNVEKNAPLRRIGIPDEVAGAAILLASDSGAFITGQTIVMDGGVTISGTA